MRREYLFYVCRRKLKKSSSAIFATRAKRAVNPCLNNRRSNDQLLQGAAKSAIADADVVFVSAATAWEAGIKVSLGRLNLPDTVESGVEDSGFEKLQISFSHAEAAAALPPHHGDPFDRMLVAQAVYEGLTLVTHDRKLEA